VFVARPTAAPRRKENGYIMSRHAWYAAVILTVLGPIALAACGGTSSTPAAEGGAANATIAALPTTVAGVQPTAGLISGGAMDRPTEVPTPARPTPPAGVRRAVHINEAVRLVPFKLLTPTALNEGFNLDATQIFENLPGQQDPALPRVVMIYQADPVGSIVLTEGPATGAPFEGEPTDVGSYKGGYTAEPMQLEWEQDGIRLSLRGREVTKEKLVEAAQTMAPYQAPGQ
jgi:hypothetical protein